MYSQTFESRLRTKLASKRVSAADVEFIMCQIRCSDIDENAKIMDNNVYFLLEQRGLRQVFEESCQELGFEFSHYSEPEQ